MFETCIYIFIKRWFVNKVGDFGCRWCCSKQVNNSFYKLVQSFSYHYLFFSVFFKSTFICSRGFPFSYLWWKNLHYNSSYKAVDAIDPLKIFEYIFSCDLFDCVEESIGSLIYIQTLMVTPPLYPNKSFSFFPAIA